MPGRPRTPLPASGKTLKQTARSRNGELEVFGRRIVDVRDQGVGILLDRHAEELFQELLDSPATVPARSKPGSRCRSHRRARRGGDSPTPLRTRSAMDRMRSGSLRKATCCSQATPTRTKRPASSARSSSHRGGTLYVRTALIPWARIAAKSVATVDGAGYSQPSSSGRNVPYVTPRRGACSAPTGGIFRALAPSPLSFQGSGSFHAAAAQKTPLGTLRRPDRDAQAVLREGMADRVNERHQVARFPPVPSSPRLVQHSRFAASRRDFHVACGRVSPGASFHPRPPSGMRRRWLTWVVLGAVLAVGVVAGVDALRSSDSETSASKSRRRQGRSASVSTATGKGPVSEPGPRSVGRRVQGWIAYGDSEDLVSRSHASRRRPLRLIRLSGLSGGAFRLVA